MTGRGDRARFRFDHLLNTPADYARRCIIPLLTLPKIESWHSQSLVMIRGIYALDHNGDSRGRMLFQLVQVEVNDNDQVIATTTTQPLFELRQDAMAMAEFAAARCHGDYGYDADGDCWWARDQFDRMLRFVVAQLFYAIDAAA